jgi:hypothetical protein
MTVSVRRQLRDRHAGETRSSVRRLDDTQLALRLDAVAASNGSAFARPVRNAILQEAARRLRSREEDQ